MTLTKEEKETLNWYLGRPPKVREAMDTWPPDTCYRGKENKGHYHLVSYSENKDDGLVEVCIVRHLADSFLPGMQVFDVPLKSLVRCGCSGTPGLHDKIKKAAREVA